MIGLAAAILWERQAGLTGIGPDRQIRTPAEPIPIGDSATWGLDSARVGIIEYSDFQCPFCARFAQQVKPVLRQDYVDSGDVLLIFKHFPLPMHEQAEAAARAGWCANRQEKFWDMHDRLFRSSGRLQDFDAQAAAEQIGLDPDVFNACVASNEAAQSVQRDKAEGEGLNVAGTPVFFLGKVTPDRRVQVTDVLAGAKAVQEFKVILDRLLAR